MKPQVAREPKKILRVTEDAVGTKVFNTDGEDIGHIQEITIDTQDDRVSYAILSFGGFLGMGDKLFAVPWVSLRYDPAQDRFVMKANKELLKNAPGFSKDKWPDLSDPASISKLAEYYGCAPAGRHGAAGRINQQQGPLGPSETRQGPEAPGKPLMDDWGKSDKH
jgi:hypothetical protein